MTTQNKLAKEFESGLSALFKSYTAPLLREVGKVGPKKILKLSSEKRKTCIDKLVNGAAAAQLAAHGTAEFRDAIIEKRQWHPKRGKGRGVQAKKKAFSGWFEEQLDSALLVYVFWKGRSCLYVGRTGSGGSRPSNHFEKYWFASTTRIDIHVVRSKKLVPMAECLATHIYQPTKNKIKSAKQRYRSPCTVCQREHSVGIQLNSLFPLRKRRRK